MKNFIMLLSLTAAFNISAYKNDPAREAMINEFYDRSKKELYPFLNQKISWYEFEKGFRVKYNNVEIPPILIDSGCSAPFSLDQSSGIRFIHINFDYLKYAKVTPNVLEFFLLHEAGHYNYPDEMEKLDIERSIMAQNSKSTILDYTNSGLYRAQSALIWLNMYQIFRYKPSIKCLLPLFVVSKLYKSMPCFIKKYQDSKTKYELKRANEIYADNFAIKYSTMEAMEAVTKEALSLNESLNFIGFDRTKRQKEICLKYGKNLGFCLAKASFAFENIATTALYLLINTSPLINNFLDPNHPSDKERLAIIKHGLQKRFLK